MLLLYLVKKSLLLFFYSILYFKFTFIYSLKKIKFYIVYLELVILVLQKWGIIDNYSSWNKICLSLNILFQLMFILFQVMNI